MRNGNDRGGPRATDLALATALLTRLPLPAAAFKGSTGRPAAAAAWAYPLVGALLGLIAVIFLSLLGVLGLPPAIAALLALILGLFLTGAMHEDGLADCADGFWGGWTRERRLEIMRDSRIGTYGVAALVLSLLLRWQALTWLIEAERLWALVAVEALSRAGMVWLMARLPQARKEGLAQSTGRPEPLTTGLALALGALATLLSGAPLLMLLLALIGTMAMAALARAKVGGLTGDVLGATQQVLALLLLAGLCTT